MKSSCTGSGADFIVCPSCEAGELCPRSCVPASCALCGYAVSSAILETLLQIVSLYDAVGAYACECGHPEMRRLPDGVYWGPACGSEVLPFSANSAAPGDKDQP